MTLPIPHDSHQSGLTWPEHRMDEFIHTYILNSNSELYNEDHEHLEDARILWLWCAASNIRKGREVLGMAEIPMFRCGKWQKARQEQQIMEWYGEDIMPDFIITLSAGFFATAPNPAKLAVLEHELYHCAHAIDEFGMPRFNKTTGQPVYTIAGHDVEEFTGVVRRYGADATGIRDMVRAANKGPEIAQSTIDGVCGTCAKKVG